MRKPRKPITQREALRMRKRIKELESHIRRIYNDFGKTRACCLSLDDFNGGRVFMAIDTDHLITARKVHRDDGKHVVALDAIRKISLP
jgi:hypothetical protein